MPPLPDPAHDVISVLVGANARAIDAPRASTNEASAHRLIGPRSFTVPRGSMFTSFCDSRVSYIRMNEPGKSSAGTRERLIDGTIAVLKERGLQGATSREIAAASGVNLAGITYHFGSKDDLVAQALLEAIRSWVEPALEALRQDLHPALRMIAAVQALQNSFERAEDLLPVYLEALVQAPRNEALSKGVDALFGELRRFLAGQIRELKTMGFLPAWIEPNSMATLLLATADGLAIHATLDPGSVDHHAVAAQAMQMLLSASDAMRGFGPAGGR
jgi:AcrR family transcriptional regulator